MFFNSLILEIKNFYINRLFGMRACLRVQLADQFFAVKRMRCRSDIAICAENNSILSRNYDVFPI